MGKEFGFGCGLAPLGAVAGIKSDLEGIGENQAVVAATVVLGQTVGAASLARVDSSQRSCGAVVELGCDLEQPLHQVMAALP